MNARDGIVARTGVSQPSGIDPHLLKKNIGVVLLVPIQDAIEDAHLGAVECEAIFFRFVDALLDFDAVEVKSQPAGVPVDLLPGALIFSGGIGAPAAAAVADGDWLLDRVP